MATITIRNVDDVLHERLKREAKANHRSLEAEVRARLGQPSLSRAARSIALERLCAAQIDPGPDYEGSVALIRAIRDGE